MRKNIWFLLFLTITFSLSAQNNKQAVTILEKSVDAIKNNSGIDATFILKESGKHIKGNYSFEGSLKNKGNKFVIETPDMQTWFDGKNQWSLVKGAQEVNLSTPTEEEIAAINPISMLRLYKKGFTAHYKGERTVHGHKIIEVELTADNKQTAWRKIFLRVSPVNYLPASIMIRDKNGQTTEIEFLKYNENINLSDSDFVFNKKNFPDVEVIDLR